MVTTIGPVVYGAGKSTVGIAIFVLAVIGTAAVTGMGIAMLGSVIPSPIWLATILAASAIFVVPYAAVGREPRLPGRQMPRGWVDTSRPMISVLRFATTWGTNLATPIRSLCLLLALGTVALLGSLPIGALVSAVIATVKVSPTVLAAMHPGLKDRTGEFVEWIAPQRPLVERMDVVMGAFLVGALLAAV